ncbi:MAG TPA: hypothetical protein VN684_12515 [Terriglobales bacterium]|nr:hypothetical protein [Terriglobales bacterium]
MRIGKFLEVAAAIIIGMCVVGSAALFAANDKPQIVVTDPVRLSYSNSWVPASEKYSPRICLSVWPDGHYRILRKNQEGQSQLLGGVLPAEQLTQLRSLLDAPDFRKLSGTRGGLLRQGAENFRAEVPRGGNVQRLVWMIPDEKSKYSKPVADIIGWMQDFQPVGSKVLLRTDFPDVCPQMGGVQPVIASNGLTGENACTRSGEEEAPVR